MTNCFKNVYPEIKVCDYIILSDLIMGLVNKSYDKI